LAIDFEKPNHFSLPSDDAGKKPHFRPTRLAVVDEVLGREAHIGILAWDAFLSKTVDRLKYRATKNRLCIEVYRRPLFLLGDRVGDANLAQGVYVSGCKNAEGTIRGLYPCRR
jgi:hypothetical protein